MVRNTPERQNKLSQARSYRLANYRDLPRLTNPIHGNARPEDLLKTEMLLSLLAEIS